MIFERLIAIAKAIMAGNDIDYDKLTPESRLMEDACLNSISMLMLVMGIEDEFKIEFPVDKAVNCKTCADAVRLIEECLNEKA